MRNPRDCFSNLVVEHTHDTLASVVRIFEYRDIVAKVLNMFKNNCANFSPKYSQTRRKTVARQSYNVLASVANFSPQNFNKFTMRQFHDIRTNVIRMSCK